METPIGRDQMAHERARHGLLTGAGLGMQEMREREEVEKWRAQERQRVSELAEKLRTLEGAPLARDLGSPTQEAGPALQRDYEMVVQGLNRLTALDRLQARVFALKEQEKAAAVEARELQALADHLPRVLSADAEAGLARLLRGL